MVKFNNKLFEFLSRRLGNANVATETRIITTIMRKARANRIPKPSPHPPAKNLQNPMHKSELQKTVSTPLESSPSPQMKSKMAEKELKMTERPQVRQMQQAK